MKLIEFYFVYLFLGAATVESIQSCLNGGLRLHPRTAAVENDQSAGNPLCIVCWTNFGGFNPGIEVDEWIAT